jgi:predicted AAA+ superfamily ATPase
MVKRKIFEAFAARLREPRRFIQVISGPRQTGKTTLAQYILSQFECATHYASADAVLSAGAVWLEQQWEIARQALRAGGEGVLAIDEIQKIPNWSETVKKLWDEDTAHDRKIKVVLLGSAQLLIQKGLTESLAGRFEVLHATHWSYPEMRDGFGFTLEKYLFFGGYPGAASLIGDENRWRLYVRDTLIETTISKDVLMLSNIHKPALLRNLFLLGCAYSGQQLSFQKMASQLQDVGNTTTLAHYLQLLQSAGLLAGLQKYAGQVVRQRSSCPKLLALNNALMTASSQFSFNEWRDHPERWGRLVETAVGNHLQESALDTRIGVYYWNDRSLEVDFVLGAGDQLTAIEVKSGRTPSTFPGIEAFASKFKVTRKLLVGGTGIPLEEFLSTPASSWL